MGNTILVIEDEYGILTLIQEALTRAGHDVEIASDGEEGIQKFDNRSYDLVITDILMPRMDGRGVARHIRNSSKKATHIIAISGTPWLLENKEFDMVLQKPFTLKTLIDSVERLPRLSARMSIEDKHPHPKTQSNPP
jgi:two-component system response regulator VanR